MSGAADMMVQADDMRPVLLRRGVGWFHTPVAPRVPGVVLCPALGREGRWAYRTMRLLAASLADAGVPVLRFDYPGTGDAPSLPAGEEKLSIWRDSVHEAVDWMQGQTGLGSVALCGVRFGALLAAHVAAARSDIAALALLSPILSGRLCARELRMASFGAPGDDGPEGGIEVDGIALSHDTLAAIAAMDLRAMRPLPAPRILLLDDTPAAAVLAETWSGEGARVTVQSFPGYGALMRPTTSNRTPLAAMRSVIGWFADLAVTGQSRTRFPAAPPSVRHPATACEQILRFGPGLRLAGTLCEPSTPSDTAVLIPNTAGDSRAGIARFGVHLAEALAQAGVASLRLDFPGLGDGVLHEAVELHPYQTDHSADIAAALDLLGAHGYTRLAGAGLCTGGYHLLRAALAQPRIELLALVNLVTFDWHEGDIVEVPQRALLHSGPVPARPVSADGALTRDILGWAGVGGRLALIYGEGDPGLAALEARFGPDGDALPASVDILPGVDHTLSRRSMQDRVAAIVREFVG